MALGRTNVEITTGGGSTGAGAQAASRQIVIAAVSPAGTAATFYQPQSLGAVRSTFDRGPLAEALTYCFNSNGGPPPMALVLNPSAVGGVSAVTQVGTGLATIAVSIAPHKAITILCTTGGAIATMKVKFSLDGGTTYGAEFTSSDTGGGSYAVRVPGTFCTLTFAAAVYVATKTCTVGTDGVVTNGAGWVGVVTQASSPIDNYEVDATVIAGGATGTATLQISLDDGITTLPIVGIPSGGVIVIPNTGLVLTCSSGPGNFVATDVYSFLAGPPGYSTSDVTTAINAFKIASGRPGACTIVFPDNPSTATTAFALGAVVDAALSTARTSDGLDWQAQIACPCSEGALGGDIVVSAGTAARSAMTSSAIRTAREGKTWNYTGVGAGQHRVASFDGTMLLRTTPFILAQRYAATLPSVGVADRSVPLNVYAIGRDELLATTPLHDVQINCLQTVRDEAGGALPYLAIQAGGFGYRNLTADAQYQDADFMRIVNAGIAALRPAGDSLIGKRPRLNSDGTIHESAANVWDVFLDGVLKRAVGLKSGGAFNVPQVSSAVASVDRGSQLGTAPRELVINVAIQALGFVSQVRFKVRIFAVEA